MHNRPNSQRRALRRFSAKRSGAKPDRKALAKALAALKSGDMLLVTRLDRLARSTLDLLNTFCSGTEDGGDSSQDAPRGGVAEFRCSR